MKLPALRVNYRRARPQVASLEQWEQPADWTATLAEIAPVMVEKVQVGSPAAKRWAYFLDRYHYLGFRVVGENLGYLARDPHFHRCMRIGSQQGDDFFGDLHQTHSGSVWRHLSRAVE